MELRLIQFVVILNSCWFLYSFLFSSAFLNGRLTKVYSGDVNIENIQTLNGPKMPSCQILAAVAWYSSKHQTRHNLKIRPPHLVFEL